MRSLDVDDHTHLTDYLLLYYMGDLDIDERIILKLILKQGFEDVDRIKFARRMVQWRDLLNTVINLRVP
jgi:hypothetical protein